MSKYDDAPGIRRSDLWTINKTPLHFKYQIDHGKEKTKALIFGSAMHKMALEPDSFWDEYAVAPEVNRRTKEGKAEWQEFVDSCNENGLTPITAEDLTQIQDMAAALRANKLAAQLLEGTHEKEFYWTDVATGEACKAKIDCLTTYEGAPYIVDYKTTDSCADGHFEFAAKRYGYQFQAGMYCEAVFQDTLVEHGFAFIAQEKTAPYAVRVYICDPEWISKGYDTFRVLLRLYHDCKESGNWYGYEGAEGYPTDLMEV